MISLEYGNEEFQAILRRELNLSSSASFHSRDALLGTQLYEYCICIIRDGEKTYVLIRGSFVSTKVYIMIKTDLPEEFRFFEVAKELEEVGLDPGKTRLVCVAGRQAPGDPDRHDPLLGTSAGDSQPSVLNYFINRGPGSGSLKED